MICGCLYVGVSHSLQYPRPISRKEKAPARKKKTTTKEPEEEEEEEAEAGSEEVEDSYAVVEKIKDVDISTGMALVMWEGNDPATKRPWVDTWEPYRGRNKETGGLNKDNFTESGECVVLWSLPFNAVQSGVLMRTCHSQLSMRFMPSRKRRSNSRIRRRRNKRGEWRPCFQRAIKQFPQKLVSQY